MGNLLFSPTGRIGTSEFLKGMAIIGIISTLIAIVPAFNFSLGKALGLVAFLLYIPAFFLLIKRSHDGGKSGWMSIVWFILLVVLTIAVAIFVQNKTGGVPLADMNELLKAAREEGDFKIMREIAKEYAPAISKNSAIPMSIASFVAWMFGAFLINLFLKQDPNENQFGDVPSA
ncbi:MAG: DUF805 domain-containing protein [Maricaulaceae bacterium]